MPDISKELRAAIARLEQLDIAGVQRDAAVVAAEHIQTDIQTTLSHPPGTDHATPWRQTGALRDSIMVSADSHTVVIGSSDPVAVDQELGTRTIPPRPFLAPAAARHAQAMATGTAQAVADAIRQAINGATL